MAGRGADGRDHRRRLNRIDPQGDEAAVAKLVAADVSLGVGLVALGAAAIVFFVQSGEPGPAKATSLRAPRAGALGVGPGGLLLRF